jgi:geranylgeranyl diphosphate synthase, type II
VKTSIPSGGETLAGYLAQARDRVDAALREWGTRWNGRCPPSVAEAMRYSLLGPGKRLRATLVFASYDALHGAHAEIAELAAAIEVVHAYSLVHDDLPCMDNDALRRGRPTTHRAFDVSTATEAGFQMVPLAAAVLAHGMAALALDPVRSRAIALELFGAAGAGGMIGGQVLDLAAEGQRVTRERLQEIHQRKTGALIAAACVIGGLAAGAGADAAEALRDYGTHVGLAFQICDDVLDATATSAELGKTAGKDAARAKSTFVSLHGVDGARREADHNARLAVDRLQEAGLVSPMLMELAHYVVTRPN